MEEIKIDMDLNEEHIENEELKKIIHISLMITI
jgi:hypothetical protein